MTPSSGCANLVRRDDHLGTIFEMHGVVVIPLAAPDEAMLLENMDDLPGNLVLVGKAAIGVGLRPCPIVRVRANGRFPYKNEIPWEIVHIFEKHGFIWGGKWYHYDTMHFEYRPEMIVPAN